MKKFPFSKKAINVMIATALVVTPLASLAPVTGTAVVEAAELTQDEKIAQYVSRLVTAYNYMTPEEKAIVKDVRLALDELEEAKWIEIVGQDVFNKAAEKDGVTEAQLLVAIKDISGLLSATNVGDKEVYVKASIDSFRTKNRDLFHALFGNAVTVDTVINFAVDFENRFFIELGAATLLNTAQNVEEVALATVIYLVDGTNAKYKEFDGILFTNLGLGVADLFDITRAVRDEVDAENNVRDIVIQAGVRGKVTTNASDAITVGTTRDLTFNLTVGESNLTLGTKVQWASSNTAVATVVGNKLEAKTAGTTTVTAKLLNLEVLSKEVTVSASGTTPPPGPGPTPVPPGPTPAPGVVAPILPPVTPGVTIIDTGKLEEALKGQEKVEVVRVTIEAGAGQVAQAKIPNAAIAVIAAKNPNAKVEVASKEGTLRLPVAEVSNAKLAAALGVAAGTEIEITVSVNKVEDTKGVVTKNKLKTVSNVVEFKIHATAGEKTVEVNRFSQYLEREISGDANFNAAKSSVVRLNDDGTFTAVPSVFKGDKAVFKSFSNSKYAVVENEVTFSDVATGKPGAWAKATIEKLGSKYIVQGKANGKFDPIATTTRAEFATLLTRSLGLSTTATYKGQFSDVKGTEWFAKDLMAAVEAGIIKGHANGTFGYNDPVTREEAAVMITRALNLVNFDKDGLDTTKDLTKFQDADKVAPWAKSSVTTLVQLGITEGRPNGFAPKAGTQRAEMATLLERFLVKVNFMN
ncbi:S-layer homology domain-containing protein [Anaerobacillus alkaliphilus]|uniref:S-layer homology domain-containing protein n=1 Tax=Anaerobacillus alkaliphilus TaxID=1548597 RepID=A0A4Q0VT06_9BACI|nr:S-layer homology domain-containing protein [Anaerobacillus alkaliphilus]RXJ01692.1 S-layer homology domain-containing protein [Anaerobacillus alkaliphilus]